VTHSYSVQIRDYSEMKESVTDLCGLNTHKSTLLALIGNSPLEDWHLVCPRGTPAFAWLEVLTRKEQFLSVKVKEDSSMC